MKYDPKLKEAAKDFTALCKKYDIAGYGVFVSETHGEFIYEMSPTWTAVTIDDNRFRIRAKKDELGKETRDRLVNGTVHYFVHLRDLCAYGFRCAEQLLEKVKTIVEVEEEGGEIFPHLEH